MKISTKETVETQYWNNDLQEMQMMRSKPQHVDINQLLSSRKHHITKTYRSFLIDNDREPSIEEMREMVTYQKPDAKLGFFDYCERYIDRSSTRVNPQTGRKISDKTIQKYRTVLNRLRKFSIQWVKSVNFKTIDLDFYYDYIDYLNDLNLSKNTIGKDIQTLKVFLNAATSDGVNDNLAFKSTRFVSMTEPSDSVYLNEAELKKMETADLPDRLDYIRDVFLLSAWTGLRWEDVWSVHSHRVRDMIRINTQKTNATVVIPVFPTVHKILAKYEGKQFPRRISSQKFNEYLKEVAKASGINDTYFKKITRGGKSVETRYKKYQLVSVHTGRRSFASNMYLRGMESALIMRITGHTSTKEFLKYIRIDNETAAKVIKMRFEGDQKFGG